MAADVLGEVEAVRDRCALTLGATTRMHYQFFVLYDRTFYSILVQYTFHRAAARPDPRTVS